ncbi:MAG: 2,5-diamino-6-(ribosylamino)-4(3H)-pyrimidinone 5'-phosphate reductase [Candidatus Methanomethylophilaceae archaeon]|nr:2,5-diamino-6-(ribosylamino)-4(3H)-pyrimidinone 5'-phosphate reductase [Candidatus Methanomethylophilaceae archaeon]
MRPFIHVNCAMSADGKIAGSDRKQVRISSDEDKSRVKNLRRKYDAILVGVGTILSDDPHLTVKGLSYDENPIRIVLDNNGRTPMDALVVNDQAPTIIVVADDCDIIWNNNVEVIRRRRDGPLLDVLEKLAEMGIESILVEGGGETIASFFREGLVDRYTVFVGGKVIGGRESPTPVDGDGWVVPEGIELELRNAEVLGNGALLTFSPKQ